MYKRFQLKKSNKFKSSAVVGEEAGGVTKFGQPFV